MAAYVHTTSPMELSVVFEIIVNILLRNNVGLYTDIFMAFN